MRQTLTPRTSRLLTFVALLVSTTDICIPSMIYRSISGWPPARDTQKEG